MDAREGDMTLWGNTEASFSPVNCGSGPVDQPSVNDIDFLLNDKKAGPFKLDVEGIKVATQSEVNPLPWRDLIATISYTPVSRYSLNSRYIDFPDGMQSNNLFVCFLRWSYELDDAAMIRTE